MQTTNRITSEEQLDDLLAQPGEALTGLMERLQGDIMILGIAGKMGVSLGTMAVRAARQAGKSTRVIGVSRFSEKGLREKLEESGVETIACDLLDPGQVAGLPVVENIIFMVGRKFGTQGGEALTWAINTLVPGYVAARFARSRIVAFSTGCVYPLAPSPGKGCAESTPPKPVGEYAQACLARERVFQYYSEKNSTPILLYRLFYAVELRYGVLHDIARWVHQDEPISRNVSHFNCIWQADANERALLCLEHCESPAAVLNVTGPEIVSVEETAQELGRLMNKPVHFRGESCGHAYLGDASRSVELFGPPRVSLPDMIAWNAAWVQSGGASMDKPTHFEVSDGKY